jgi:glycine/D-amino acid oxidase-like deaminating enzyme
VIEDLADRHLVTTALATGRLIADIALDRTPFLDPTPFDPRRAMPT